MPHEHEKIIDSLKKDLSELLENSNQAIYVYLDDVHKFCNEKYAKMLGFASSEEWEKIDDPAGTTVDKKSQDVLISAYTKSQEHLAASQIEVTWKRKDGKLTPSKVILVPYPAGGHLAALHFVEKM